MRTGVLLVAALPAVACGGANPARGGAGGQAAAAPCDVAGRWSITVEWREMGACGEVDVPWDAPVVVTVPAAEGTWGELAVSGTRVVDDGCAFIVSADSEGRTEPAIYFEAQLAQPAGRMPATGTATLNRADPRGGAEGAEPCVRSGAATATRL